MMQFSENRKTLFISDANRGFDYAVEVSPHLMDACMLLSFRDNRTGETVGHIRIDVNGISYVRSNDSQAPNLLNPVYFHKQARPLSELFCAMSDEWCTRVSYAIAMKNLIKLNTGRLGFGEALVENVKEINRDYV